MQEALTNTSQLTLRLRVVFPTYWKTLSTCSRISSGDCARVIWHPKLPYELPYEKRRTSSERFLPEQGRKFAVTGFYASRDGGSVLRIPNSLLRTELKCRGRLNISGTRTSPGGALPPGRLL